MNPKPPAAPPAPAEEHPEHKPEIPAPTPPHPSSRKSMQEDREGSPVPAPFKQLHELQRLQSERIEQLFRLLETDREETLATIQEMRGTMELVQQMIGQADQLMTNLGAAVAALVKMAPMIQEMLDALQAEE